MADGSILQRRAVREVAYAKPEHFNLLHSHKEAQKTTKTLMVFQRNTKSFTEDDTGWRGGQSSKFIDSPQRHGAQCQQRGVEPGRGEFKIKSEK
jgi:hypothetical protein